jgi:hypothetical protein
MLRKKGKGQFIEAGVGLALLVVTVLTSVFGPVRVTYADFSSPAFPCDGSFYQVRTPGSTSNTSLYKLVLDQTGNYSEQEIGPLSPSYTGANALGYNPADGYLYAFITTPMGGINYHLYRFNDSGVVTDVGLVNGLSADGGSISIPGATFGPDGKMYAIQNVGGRTGHWVEIGVHGRNGCNPNRARDRARR